MRLSSTHILSLNVAPYWKLTNNLEHLSIQPRGYVYSWGTDSTLGSETEESDLTFELPFEQPATAEARQELDVAIASRTILAAAKGGQLRRLHCNLPAPYLDRVFAIRALLPHWVAVEELELSDRDRQAYGGAAASLRAVLAHASLWLETSSFTGTRDDRLLTAHDVQSIHDHFKIGREDKAVPRYVRESRAEQPIELYLPWLRDDQELAQKVADAWSAVVKRGGEDLVKCPCAMCKDKLGKEKVPVKTQPVMEPWEA